jgi:hypothetical protein
MADEQRSQPAPEPKEPGGLGLGDLSMNVVAASATEEPSEVGRRTGRTWLILLGVLIVVALLAFIGRSLTSLSPGAEAEARLRAKLQVLPAWQTGLIQSARYVSGAELRVDFAPQLSLVSEGNRKQVKDSAVTIMRILMEERPNRDLSIEGYQNDKAVLHAEYRSKGALVGPGGRVEPEIVVHMAGEEEGLAGAVSQATRGSRR